MGQARRVKLQVIVAGKPALKYAREGVEEYTKRLGRHGGCELIHIKDGSSEEVSARLLERSEGSYRIILDERGKALGTRELHKKMDDLRLRGDIKTVSLLIGAADGHTESLRKEADLLLSVSGFTLQHELALVVLLEQLYRIASIDAGSPYHRD